MATFGLIEYNDASPEVRAVYDDIMTTRKTDWINNSWKAIAHDPALLKRTWESIKQVMALGAFDLLTKEMIYIAVSVTNTCGYCIASHTASAFGKGMTDAMFKELQAVIGMQSSGQVFVSKSVPTAAAKSQSPTPFLDREGLMSGSATGINFGDQQDWKQRTRFWAVGRQLGSNCRTSSMNSRNTLN